MSTSMDKPIIIDLTSPPASKKRKIKRTGTEKIRKTKEAPKPKEELVCPICLDSPTDRTTSECCKQIFCSVCLEQALTHSPYCPLCMIPLRTVVGNQPNGVMTHTRSRPSLPGYDNHGTIVISYNIPSGTQGPQHPNPGHRFHGTTRTAYLPDNDEGRHVLSLLRRAFDARLIFTVGTSHTTGQSNTVVWNDIHHKTSTHGGPTSFGYPDPFYLDRVKEELKAKGIY